MFSFLKRPRLPAVTNRMVAVMRPGPRYVIWANKLSKRLGEPRIDVDQYEGIALLIPDSDDLNEAAAEAMRLYGPAVLLELFMSWTQDTASWPNPQDITLTDWLRIDVQSQVYDAGSGGLKIDRSDDLLKSWMEWAESGDPT